MPRWYDEESDKYGGMSLGPFCGSRLGKLILLAVFVACICAGIALGLVAKNAFGL